MTRDEAVALLARREEAFRRSDAAGLAATYTEDAGAPYGAGHCNFTTEQRVGTIRMLDAWVREGTVPGSASIATFFPGDEAVSNTYAPPEWPAEPAS